MRASPIHSSLGTGTQHESRPECTLTLGGPRVSGKRDGTPKARGGRVFGRLATHGPSGAKAFFCAGRGGVAVESALSISVLVLLFAGLMAIAHSVYGDDRMGRAARAAARAVALVADSSTAQTTLDSTACKAIRGELGLKDDFKCEEAWTVSVKANLTPSSLETGANKAGVSGDMVLVEIKWKQAPWGQALSALEGSDARLATGVARREPADPGA